MTLMPFLEMDAALYAALRKAGHAMVHHQSATQPVETVLLLGTKHVMMATATAQMVAAVHVVSRLIGRVMGLPLSVDPMILGS